MAENVDLYTILRSYANKTRSANIPLVPFVRFLQKNAGGESRTAQRLASWAIDTHTKVVSGLDDLARAHKVEVREEGGAQTIVLLEFYAELVAAAYAKIDETINSPLPDEKQLRITLPGEQTRPIVMGNAFIAYLASPQASVLPVIKLMFSGANGSALVLSAHLPGRLLEIALSKIRDNCKQQSTLEFFTHKLITHFNKQEAHIREFISAFMNRINDCITGIMEGGDFSFSVWMFLCQLIKNYVEEQVERANDRKAWHIALAQSADIVLWTSNYYKSAAMDTRDKNIVFDNMIKMFLDPPYMYKLRDIYTFQTPKGKTVKEVYGEKEVSDYLSELTTSSNSSEMPEVIRFNSGGEEFLVKKDKVVALCKNLIDETRPVILQEIKSRWTKKLEEYHTDSTMRFDDDFEEMLDKLVQLFVPNLAVVARDKRTAVIQDETGPYSPEDALFSNFRPIPWRAMFGFRRESILSSCRLSLPLWYSFSFLVKFISFLKHGPKSLSEAKKKSMSKKTEQSKKEQESKETPQSKKKTGSHISSKERLKTAALKIAEKILPENSTLDSQLSVLNSRWNHILNKKDSAQLTRDVNSVIKTYMMQELKVQTRSTIAESALDDTAHNIINLHKPLKNINDKASLHLYIKIYILKMLTDTKF